MTEEDALRMHCKTHLKKIVPRQTVHCGNLRWRIIVPKDLREGMPSRLFFADEAAALRRAAELEADRGKISGSFKQLSDKARMKVMLCLEKLGGDCDALESAVAGYLKQQAPATEKTITTIAAELIESKRGMNCSQPYLKTLKCSLGNFTAAIGTEYLHEVTAPKIEAWLTGNGWSSGTRKGYLTDVRTLYSFAHKRGYVRANPSLGVDKPKVERPVPGIHTPQKVHWLFSMAMLHDPGLVKYLALLYFGFLRPKEAKLIEKVQVHEGTIEVTPKVSKTRQRRFVEINSTLQTWLNVSAGEYQPKNLRKRLVRLQKLCGFPWPHDAARHSCVSYGVVIFGAMKTASYAGHSEAVLFAHYRERVTAKQSTLYWGITPDIIHKQV